MFKIKNIELLQLFSEGAGTGASPGNPQSSTSSLQGTQTPAAEGTTGVEAAGNAASSAAAEQEETAEAAFARFIEKYGEDAEPLKKHHQKNFGKRYDSFKETKAKAQRQEEILKTIAGRYPSVADGDLDGLEKAFMTDARFFSDEAIARGRSAEDLAAENWKDVQLERLQNAEKIRTEKEAEERAAREFNARLSAEAEDMKKTYPDFNLNEEIKNPMMRNMLLSNIPLIKAYQAVHHDELVKKVAQDAKTATISNIASKGTRAHEGASSVTPPAAVTKDFSNYSREQFMKIFNSK